MPKILLVCHASADIGLGHLSRLTALAQSLESDGMVVPETLIFGDFFPKDGILNFSTHLFSLADDFVTTVLKVVAAGDFNAVAFDLHALQDIKGFKSLLFSLKNNGIRLIAIDSLLEFCDVLDLVWIPSFNFDIANHTHCKCIIKFGWDSFLIQKRLPSRVWTKGSRVLVLTGGSDVARLGRTLPAQIDSSLNEGSEVHWVKGPFSEAPSLPDRQRLAWNIHDAPTQLDELIVESDYVLTVFGVAFFEVLQYGIPTVVFSPYDNKDVVELSALSEQNLAAVAGSSFEAVERLNHLMRDDKRAREYSSNSVKKLAVNGAQNLADEIYLLIGV